MKRLFNILLCSLCSTICFGQFQPNSIGVAYLTKDLGDSYQLIVVMPYETLHEDYQLMRYEIENKKIYLSGQMDFFDKSGILATMDEPIHFTFSFWCSNDGGDQHRPTLTATIRKDKFKRELNRIKSLQNVVCFVIVNRSDKKTGKPDYGVSKQIKMEGDYNNDGQVDCFLWTRRDLAENCAEDPIHHMALFLQVGNDSNSLRCCGP